LSCRAGEQLASIVADAGDAAWLGPVAESLAARFPAFETSIRANPRDASTYVNVGQFSLQIGNPREAADYFAEAMTIEPSGGGARRPRASAVSRDANPR